MRRIHRITTTLLLISILLQPSPVAQSQSAAYIIVHALNPEDIEIASIERMDPHSVQIYDGSTLIGYGASTAEIYNQPIEVLPGAHTIRVVFNGMTKEQAITLEGEETRVLVMHFDRSTFDLKSQIGNCSIESALSGTYSGTTPLIQDLKSCPNQPGWNTEVHFREQCQRSGSYQLAASLSFEMTDNAVSWNHTLSLDVVHSTVGVVCPPNEDTGPYYDARAPANSTDDIELSTLSTLFDAWYVQYSNHSQGVSIKLDGTDLSGAEGDYFLRLIGAEHNAGLNVTWDDYFQLTGSNSYHASLPTSHHVWNTIERSGGGPLQISMASVPYDLPGTGIKHKKTIDLSVVSITPIQVLELEGQPLVKNKATAVQVVIRKIGDGATDYVPVRLQTGTTTLVRYYVADPSNLNTQYALIADQTTFPLIFDEGDFSKTIYFFDDGLVPTGSTFEASVAVDYLDLVSETDETNNTASISIPVIDTAWSYGSDDPSTNLNIHYFRTDWENTNIADFNSYYQASNVFMANVYPVSSQRFTPSKDLTFYTTAIFRGADDKLDVSELGNWIFWEKTRMRLAHPTADRFIATVPEDWFAAETMDTTNNELTSALGVAYPNMPELVVAEARQTSKPNGPSIAAHEIGHSYLLDLDCEEYEPCNGHQDPIGILASPGVWVDRRILINTPTVRSVYCFMGAYNDNETVEYWIDAADYTKLLIDHQAPAALSQSAVVSNSQGILARGTFDAGGTVTLNDWYVLPEAELSTLPSGPYTFEYQDANGQVLYQQSFDISYTVLGEVLSQARFVFTIPYVKGMAKIVVKQNDVLKAQKVVSANAPVVTVGLPNGGEALTGQATIQWSGSDSDGDTLTYAVLFSPDNGATWETIVTDLAATGYTWNLTSLSAGGRYLVKVIATDGINTGQDRSDAPFTIESGIYLPVIRK